MSTDAAIRDLEESIRACADHSRLFDLYGRLGQLQALAGWKLFAPPQQPDRLLTAEEAATALGIGVSTLYRRAASFPFVVKHGRIVRFSEQGIAQWIANKRRQEAA